MSDFVQYSAGAHRAMVTGSNLVDLDAERRARLRAEHRASRQAVRSARRRGRAIPAASRIHARPVLGRDGPDAA